MAVHDAHRALLLIEDRQGVEVGLGAKRLQHIGGGGGNGYRQLFVEQGGEVAAFLAQRRRRLADGRQHFAGVGGRRFLGATEQVALEQVDAHLAEHGELFLELDAFGDHLGARGLGHVQDGTDELAFHRITVDAVDEVAIDLHVVGAQFRPQAQARIAGAQVVQGDGKAHVAVVVQGGVEQIEIVGGRLLGQFDHHPAGRDTVGLQQLQGAAWLVIGVKQRIGRDIEKQQAIELLFAEAATGALAAGQLQFAEQAGLAGSGEQGQRRVQGAVGGAASQRFITENAALGDRHDGLEQAVQITVGEDLPQRAQLIGDGHGGSLCESESRGRPLATIKASR
ncbi:hypothetical protein SRABI70_01637 [Pseudomonas sp. Bi70]|nr:hypothetical protein SRABI70_01637 [Pseudomonas sp. Bi70]